MNIKMKKQNLAHVFLIMLLLFMTLLGGCEKKEFFADAGETIKITFFDVGKGDAILIETENANMLIDAGYDNTSQVILDYLDQQGKSSLDYMVITHFDKDHVGGVDRVLEAVTVERILQPDYESDGGQYQEYQEMIKAENQQPELVTDTLKLSFDGVECLIYPPQQQAYEEEDNDFSLVISMTYGQQRFLFAGDCEKERLEELLSQTEFDLKHDLLKVPHHGRKEKNSEEFLQAVSPEAAIITCSEEEPGDDKVRKILKQTGAQIFLTSEGTVTCFSDGERMRILQE